jgi:hypothetical protein
MATLQTSFKGALQTAMHDLLWRQWSCMGAGLDLDGNESSPDAHIIDPEALILATTLFGRRDQRLFDEALAWLARFGSLINVQRLKNLQQGGKLGDSRVLAAVAAYVKRHGKLLKWGVLAESGGKGVREAPEPFFPPAGKNAAVFHGEPDPDFLVHGWLRRTPRQKTLAMPPSPARLANLLLSFRALIGVSSRCEILACLLSRPSARAAELARLTGYSAQSVQMVMGEMMLSGRLGSDDPRRTSAREKAGRGVSRRYYLQPGVKDFLWPAQYAPKWLPWAALFTLVQGVDKVLEVAQDETLLSIHLRRVLEEHVCDLTEGLGHHLFGYNPDLSGAWLLSSLARDLPQVLARL